MLTLERGGLPATVVAGLPGRRLGEVADIRLTPGDALIVSADCLDEWLYLRLEIGTTPIEVVIAG